MFIVIELQSYKDGECGNIVTPFTDRNEAESKYHTILSAAAVSTVYKHAAAMLTEEGVRLKSECYIHEPEPTPEPEEE